MIQLLVFHTTLIPNPNIQIRNSLKVSLNLNQRITIKNYAKSAASDNKLLRSAPTENC